MHSSAAASQALLPGLIDLFAPLTAGSAGTGEGTADIALPHASPADFDDYLNGLLAAANGSAPVPGTPPCPPPSALEAPELPDLSADRSAVLDSGASTTTADGHNAVSPFEFVADQNRSAATEVRVSDQSLPVIDTSDDANQAVEMGRPGDVAIIREPVLQAADHGRSLPVGPAQHAALSRYLARGSHARAPVESAESAAIESAATDRPISESSAEITREPDSFNGQPTAATAVPTQVPSPFVAPPAHVAVAAADTRGPAGQPAVAHAADDRRTDPSAPGTVSGQASLSGAPMADAPVVAATMPSLESDDPALRDAVGDLDPAAEDVVQDNDSRLKTTDADRRFNASTGPGVGSDRGLHLRTNGLAAESAIAPAVAGALQAARANTPQSPDSVPAERTAAADTTGAPEATALGESSPADVRVQGQAAEGTKPSVVQQVSQAIETWRGSLAEQGTARFAAWLTPPDLGHVWVELTRTADGITARLSASDDGVQSVLESQATELRQALADSGVEVTALDLSGRSAGNSMSDRQQSPDQPAEQEAPVAGRFAPHARARAAPRAGAVDVRV